MTLNFRPALFYRKRFGLQVLYRLRINNTLRLSIFFKLIFRLEDGFNLRRLPKRIIGTCKFNTGIIIGYYIVFIFNYI